MTVSERFNEDTTGDEVVQSFIDQVKGRTFAITGPSVDSLGAETALSLARHANPAKLILFGRNESRIKPIMSQIQALNPSIQVFLFAIDLSSSTSIHAAAEQVLSNPQIGPIHVLINNAGVMACPYTPVEEWKDKRGSPVELQFAANHLGHFLLTTLLMDRIRQSGPGARVVNVSAASHRFSAVNLDDLNFTNGAIYHPWRAYAQSKSAIILITKALASRIPSEEVTILSLHPGIIFTGLARHMESALPEPALIEAHLSFPNAESIQPKPKQQGCSTMLVAALDPTLQIHSAATFASDEKEAERLWEVSKEILGI
ncbi:uncharacterized protein N7503_002522 [Penicillium pulvis]|uniref:uncharacterized protein n=1 Tax=Penicillium pulvis TaxID=1562058 RepID=UPI002548B4FD|nr:uncharacterized protein N7503_002522 [Penicillium pulvis]KAJ5810304.1 hypothetical protein N7503_002522 [Penicillium pulvis]